MSITHNGTTYSDWFLPSTDELNAMCVNLKGNGLGGFSLDFYWSSSERGAHGAWSQDFYNGAQDYYGKNNEWYVRAVRAF